MRAPRFNTIPLDDPRLEEGVRLFNAGQFFESHEVWESLWHDVGGGERALLQGLIQLAAAYHHLQHHNRTGAAYLYGRSRPRLAKWGASWHGLELGELLQQADAEFASLDARHSLKRSPMLRFSSRR